LFLLGVVVNDAARVIDASDASLNNVHVGGGGGFPAGGYNAVGNRGQSHVLDDTAAYTNNNRSNDVDDDVDDDVDGDASTRLRATSVGKTNYSKQKLVSVGSYHTIHTKP
jgi:hypothetical protein